jgi:hypothetical protein
MTQSLTVALAANLSRDEFEREADRARAAGRQYRLTLARVR